MMCLRKTTDSISRHNEDAFAHHGLAITMHNIRCAMTLLMLPTVKTESRGIHISAFQ